MTFFIYLVLEKWYSIKYYLNTFTFYSRGIDPSIITLSYSSEANSFGGIYLTFLSLGVNLAFISEGELLFDRTNSIFVQIQNLISLSKEALLIIIILLNIITLLIIWGLSKKVLIMEIFNKLNIFTRPYRFIEDHQERRQIYEVTISEFYNDLKNTENRFRRVLIDVIGITLLTLNLLIFFGQK